MTEHLIDKNSMTLDNDVVIEITPLSPIMSSSVRAAKGEQKNQPMERMVAIQVSVFMIQYSTGYSTVLFFITFYRSTDSIVLIFVQLDFANLDMSENAE